MNALTSAPESVQSIDSEDDGKHVAQIVETCQQFAKLFTESSVLKEIDGIYRDDA